MDKVLMETYINNDAPPFDVLEQRAGPVLRITPQDFKAWPEYTTLELKLAFDTRFGWHELYHCKDRKDPRGHGYFGRNVQVLFWMVRHHRLMVRKYTKTNYVSIINTRI